LECIRSGSLEVTIDQTGCGKITNDTSTAGAETNTDACAQTRALDENVNFSAAY
jgi:hypothetical protein